MKSLIRVLIILWELPQTIVAAVMMAVIRNRITGTEDYRDTFIKYAEDFPGGISLGRFIILNKRYYNNWISKKHEYGHSVQSLYLGWLYLPVVGLPSILRVLIWKYRKLGSKSYYTGYPENWANRLGFDEEDYLELKKRLK